MSRRKGPIMNESVLSRSVRLFEVVEGAAHRANRNAAAPQKGACL
jgi:hypothetical protein